MAIHVSTSVLYEKINMKMSGLTSAWRKMCDIADQPPRRDKEHAQINSVMRPPKLSELGFSQGV